MTPEQYYEQEEPKVWRNEGGDESIVLKNSCGTTVAEHSVFECRPVYTHSLPKKIILNQEMSEAFDDWGNKIGNVEIVKKDGLQMFIIKTP